VDELAGRRTPALSAGVRARGVLLVTGAWHPEAAGGSLQARALAHACRDRVGLHVLATSRRPELPTAADDEGVPVTRVALVPESRASVAAASARLSAALWRLRHAVAVVHLVGWSRKAVLLAALARELGLRVVLRLTSAGADDPMALRARGRLAAWVAHGADALVAPSPALRELALRAGIDERRVRRIDNGVDLARFRPATTDERVATRAALGLPADGALALCVGHFAPEKGQRELLAAWARGPARAGVLAFAGAEQAANPEVDPAYAASVRADAAALGLADRVAFLGHREDVALAYRAADLFAFASVREGRPNVVLEAMASGLPCVVHRLPGITDDLVEDGVSGRLVAIGDADGFADAMAQVAGDPALRSAWGAAARQAARPRSLAACAEAHLALWRELGAGVSS
jgi:glycosyltransferase involved in cell wall biosynthesis